ncbi:carboxypeptidase regulatory-like domain-containing protein [bacterium]|nr:MAG: carboxypeptidase regulatory-like domain-containing protein [bacterium]
MNYNGNPSSKTAVTIIRLVMVLFVTLMSTFSIAQAQNVIKKGKLKITFVDKSAQFSSSEMVVPKLEEDEGVIVFTIADAARKYFKEDGVLDWIRSNSLSIDGIFFDGANSRIKGNQIRLKFAYEFLGAEDATSKRLKIDSREFTFNEVLTFYKQQVVFFSIDVSEAPQYDRDIFGSLQIFVPDGDGARISVQPKEGKTITGTVRSGVATFTDLTEGDYSISISKSGYQTENKTIRVNAGQPTPMNVTLKKETVRLTMNVNVSGYDLLIVNQAGQSINQLNKPSSFSIDLEPDTYTIRITKQNYKDESRQITLYSGDGSKSISVTLNSATQPKIESKKSSNTWLYLLLAAAAGGAAYYFTAGSGGGTTGSGSYGNPPALPTPFSR